MANLKLIVSLTTQENDYQRAQAAAATEAAQRLGVELQVLYAENDSVKQSQQLLEIIQSSSSRPDGIVIHPVGTGLIHVAQAAAAAGIGWAIVNHQVDYLSGLRIKHSVPLFQISFDQEETGRVQGRQCATLLPEGGTILYIQGPTSSAVAAQRLKGMQRTKPDNIQMRMIRGAWTEQSGYKAASSWLSLSTSHQVPIQMIASQNDAMAMGAIKALNAQTIGAAREKLLQVPFIGCDGVPEVGQEWVRRGVLAATIIMPPLAGDGVATLVGALRSGAQPQEKTIVAPTSYPSLEKLKASVPRREPSQAAGK